MKQANINSDYLDKSYRANGVGGWRKLYTRFINKLETGNICELGAGSPDFLMQFENWQRTAIDIGDKYQSDFEANNINFLQLDLNHQSIKSEKPFDVMICSDVFEHLFTPLNTLKEIKRSISDNGVLFSHVPNEFRVIKTANIMLGLSNSLHYHTDHEEWSDPHFRRFTDKGFRKFLSQEFEYNLKINDILDPPWTKVMRKCFKWVPYGIEWGPTYISTNSKEKFEQICKLKQTL